MAKHKSFFFVVYICIEHIYLLYDHNHSINNENNNNNNMDFFLESEALSTISINGREDKRRKKKTTFFSILVI